jgi:phosphohistidine phosphatase
MPLVILVRHGLAAERGDAYPDDTKRPLVSKGIVSLKKEARALAMMGVEFDQILTSPLVRAKQTADVLAPILGKPPVASIRSLAPGGKYAAIIDDLSRFARKENIALVGHEPDLGELAARLLGMRGPIEFKKGAMCAIELKALPPTGPGSLRWFVPPKMLRRMK